MASNWKVSGDWFDLCNCNIPCPCNFGQAPTYGDCAGVLAWHIHNGHYGDVRLDGLCFIMVGGFKGNFWDGTVRDLVGGFFLDERADERQREALQAIFGGRAGGFPAEFSKLFAEVRGTEFVPIRFEVAKDLAYWSVEIPAKVVAMAEPDGPAGQEGTDDELARGHDIHTDRRCHVGKGCGSRGGSIRVQVEFRR